MRLSLLRNNREAISIVFFHRPKENQKKSEETEDDLQMVFDLFSQKSKKQLKQKYQTPRKYTPLAKESHTKNEGYCTSHCYPIPFFCWCQRASSWSRKTPFGTRTINRSRSRFRFCAHQFTNRITYTKPHAITYNFTYTGLWKAFQLA